MAKHTEESVHRTLQTEWPSVERREINHGFQFTLPEGTKVNLFPSTGKVNVQGKDCAEKKRAEQLLQSASTVSSKPGIGLRAIQDTSATNGVTNWQMKRLQKSRRRSVPIS
jgi:hypothetical protein